MVILFFWHNSHLYFINLLIFFSFRFQLVVTAVVPNNQIGVQGPNSSSKVQEDALRSLNKKVMTPKILKERKEIFYRNLLEKAKDYHEVKI